jgi:hypothetical protein
MLTNQTIEKLNTMKLAGMVAALEKMACTPDWKALSF